MGVGCFIWPVQNQRLSNNFISATCSSKILDGRPFISGPASNFLVLICYKLMVCFWTISLTTRYIRSMCLVALLDLLLCKKKTTALWVSWFLTRFESRGAHGCREQWHGRDMMVYTGLSLHEDKNPASCVRWCIIIYWVKTPSIPSFIG
jgi:hypothetical protein